MPPFYADPNFRPPLNPERYSIDEEESKFFKQLTGIHNDDELRKHILAVQAKAYNIYGYPCIRRFSFLRLKIARLPGYPKALSLLKSRTRPILLDIGCCFGNDTRKAVVDGWPVHDVIASDLRQGFWDCGHDLFKRTSSTFPAAFIPGDIFDPSFLQVDVDSTTSSTSPPPPQNLSSLSSLTPLTSHISAIHASAFFHLFSEAQQRALACKLAALLLPERGSIIFGQHGARPEKGFRVEAVRGPPRTGEGEGDGDKDKKDVAKHLMFCHSPESWTQLWTEDIFGPNGVYKHKNVRVHVDARLKEVERWDFEHPELDEQRRFWVLDWSVEVL